ncbi:glycoside hydrolase family 5 protein [Halosimplex aquaticum]
MLRGVNVPDPVWGTERADARGKSYWQTLRFATNRNADWYTRVLRIPVEPQSIEDAGVEAVARDYLDRAVSIAAERGVYALIDYHAVERYDTEGIDERIRAFWSEVAPRYADDSHVLYELFSEPTEPASDGIESWRTWKDAAEPWLALIREESPETPVVVGSPRWSSMTRHAAAEPVDDDNVLYSAHVYPSWEPETWEPTFGDPALDVPVFVTEWGYVDDESIPDSHVVGTTESWGRPFRRWLEAHENVSWCARAFDSQWVPSMFDEEWNLLGGNAHMGVLTKQWLADERDSYWPPNGAGAPTATPLAQGRPPDPPADLRVEAVGETTTRIAWDGALDPDGDDVLQYRVGVGDGERTILRGPSDRSS